MDLRVLFSQQYGFFNQTNGILWFYSLRSLAFWYLGVSASFINPSSKYITALENYYFWSIMMWKMTMERSNSLCKTTKEGWSYINLVNFKQVSWLTKPLVFFYNIPGKHVLTNREASKYHLCKKWGEIRGVYVIVHLNAILTTVNSHLNFSWNAAQAASEA